MKQKLLRAYEVLKSKIARARLASQKNLAALGTLVKAKTTPIREILMTAIIRVVEEFLSHPVFILLLFVSLSFALLVVGQSWSVLGYTWLLYGFFGWTLLCVKSLYDDSTLLKSKRRQARLKGERDPRNTRVESVARGFLLGLLAGPLSFFMFAAWDKVYLNRIREERKIRDAKLRNR